MAKDEKGLNLATDSAEADDDVVDLLEVVTPGKTVPKASDADEDFSADLESMLDTLSQAEQAKAAADGVQPFPDPTPVDHAVDAHESLDMPGMDDFDHILSTLGAPPPPSDASLLDEQDAPDMFPAAPMPDLDAVPVVSPIPATTPVDLDGLPPGIDTAAPPEEPDTAAAGIAPEAPDMDHAPVTEPDVEKDTLSPPPEQAAEDILAEDFPDAPAPDEGEPDSTSGQRPDSFGEVDLNELDALLDDMLATAPASGPASAPEPEAAAAPAVSAGPTVSAASAVSGGPGEAASAPDPASSRLDVETARKMEDMELTLHNLGNRITALENRQNELHANIDKLAAEAAAKIIREELAALLKAGI